MTLRELRLQAKKTVTEVATELSISPRTLYAYEQGTRGIDIITLNKLARVYDVELDEAVKAFTKTRTSR